MSFKERESLLKHNRIKYSGILLLTSIGLLFGVGGIEFSRAEIEVNELPPRTLDSGRRRSSGTRGECSQINNIITLIAPPESPNSKTKVPLTTLPHPTFTWHMSEESDTPVKFTLLEPGRTLYVEELKGAKAGFVNFTLPETAPALEINKEYRWTVSLLCSREHPSRNPLAEASIKRIVLPSMPKTEKNLACNTYKQANIWYDLLACYSKSKSKDEKNKFHQLLGKIDLSDLFSAK